MSESCQWTKRFLVFRLEEMEEKYLMRESKPEDIQMITELKAMLTERDQVIKKLIVRFGGGRDVTMLVTVFANQQSIG